jgi:hypothetical protein
MIPPSNKTGWIKWLMSTARETILEDLCPPNGILFGKDQVDAKVVWNFYNSQPGFEEVVFEQFCPRLNDHRKQASTLYLRSPEEEVALVHHRSMYPWEQTNNMGQLVFHMTQAGELIREDIKHSRHVGKTPSEFQMTRPKYQVFKKKRFKDCIYQEICRKKFLYYLEQKHDKDRAGIPRPTELMSALDDPNGTVTHNFHKN